MKTAIFIGISSFAIPSFATMNWIEANTTNVIFNIIIGVTLTCLYIFKE